MTIGSSRVSSSAGRSEGAMPPSAGAVDMLSLFSGFSIPQSLVSGATKGDSS